MPGMKRTIAPMAVAMTVLALSACSRDSTETPTSQTSDTPTPASATTKARSDLGEPSSRGNYVGTIGSPTAAGDQRADKPSVTWTITDIAVDAPCELSIAKPPTNGHFVVASMDVETAEDFDEDLTLPGGFHPSNNWSIVGPDGYVQPRAASDTSIYCIDAEWPKDLAPGSKYRFRVVFDSKTPTGILVYKASGWRSGWEWQFPAGGA